MTRSSEIAGNQRKLAGIDAVRALACLWVFGVHVIKYHPQYGENNSFIVEFLRYGYLGVGAFFVLSGFLLSLPFWKAYNGDESIPSVKSYAIKRAARIIPEFYLCLLFCAIFYEQFNSRWGLLQVITSATFTNNLIAGFYTPRFNAAFWSLGIEMTFYLLLPLTLLPLFKYRRFIDPSFYIIGLMLLIAVGQFLFLRAAPAIGEWFDNPAVFSATALATRQNAMVLYSHFLIGVLAGKFHLQFNNRKAVIVGWHRYDTLVAGVCVLSLGLYQAGLFRWIRGLDYMIYGWPVYGIVIAIILFCLPRTGWLCRIFENGFIRYTAMWSYGIYLWHKPMISLVAGRWPHHSDGTLMYFVPYTLLVLGLSYCVAIISHAMVGRPAIHYAAGFITHRSSDSIPDPGTGRCETKVDSLKQAA